MRRILIVAAAAALMGCSGEAGKNPAKLEVDVGAHHLRFVPPAGWEHLDHGQQHLFRLEEMQISMTDLGPPPRQPDPGVDTLDAMAAHALRIAVDLSRREIQRTSRTSIHGSTWIETETWDRVTHADPRRMACTLHEGNILVVSHDYGPTPEVAGVAFAELLGTIELLPSP